MKVFGMGVPELLIILAVILIIFGPKNLPKLGSALGKTVKNLREGMASDKDKDEDEEEDEDEDAEVVEEDEEEEEAEPVKKKTTKKVSKKSE